MTNERVLFMNYENALAYIIDIAQKSKYISGEENTKRNLIEPILTKIMGYQIPDDISLEYVADIGVKSEEKVDYAISIEGIKKIIVEAKSIEETNDKEYISQLYRYFAASEAEIGILTNGIEWSFFTDIKKTNIMDLAPFRVINLQFFSLNDFTFLAQFFKENYSSEIYKKCKSSSNEQEREAAGQIASRIKNYLETDDFIAHIKEKCSINDYQNAEIKEIVKNVTNGAYLLKYKSPASNEISLIMLTQEIIRAQNIEKIQFIGQTGDQYKFTDITVERWEELPVACAKYCFYLKSASSYNKIMDSLAEKKKWLNRTNNECFQIGSENVYGYNINTAITTKAAIQRSICILKAFNIPPERAVCVLKTHNTPAR